MFNFKISGIVGGAAFILSLVIGFLSGAGLLVVLIRALMFALVFFGLTCLIFWLVAQFLPELLNGPEDDLGFGAPGSRVDISVDSPITGAFPRDNSEVVDDIAGKPSTPVSLPLDQGRNTRYNKDGDSLDDGEFADPKSFGSAGLDSGADSGMAKAEALPDMDGLVEASPDNTAGEIEADTSVFDEPRRPISSSKKPAMAGDFDAKELAQGIRTVLKKDNKG